MNAIEEAKNKIFSRPQARITEKGVEITRTILYPTMDKRDEVKMGTFDLKDHYEFLAGAVEGRIINCFNRLEANKDRIIKTDNNEGLIWYVEEGTGFVQIFSVKSVETMEILITKLKDRVDISGEYDLKFLLKSVVEYLEFTPKEEQYPYAEFIAIHLINVI